MKGRKKRYPSDLDELTLLSQPKVSLGQRTKKEENCTFSSPVTRVPDNESKDENREQKEGDKEVGVVNHNENENGDGKAYKKKGCKDIEGQSWYGLTGTAMVI